MERSPSSQYYRYYSTSSSPSALSALSPSVSVAEMVQRLSRVPIDDALDLLLAASKIGGWTIRLDHLGLALLKGTDGEATS